MSARWVSGNHFTLLENGEEFFPRVFECIEGAQREVLIETFILFDDKVGKQLHAAMLGAARRGVRVHLMIDGFGSPDLSPAFIGALTEAGVKINVFDPAKPVFGMRMNWFRRMHRKIVVVDGERAFVGGINYSADHLGDFGPQAKQDYSIECEGPIVEHIHHFARAAARIGVPSRRWRRRKPMVGNLPDAGTAEAMLVVRDNRDHTTDIERHYRAAIRTAKKRVIIANAYFFPGYRLLRELRRAAKRGVEVSLILQGEPDMPIVKTAASLLYDHLIRSGVKIYEYQEKPLHGKVAIVDDLWSTVGSSNLDPLSLSLNLEANVMIRDREFNGILADRLEHLMRHSCQEAAARSDAGSRWAVIRGFFVYHFLRNFPSWARALPSHVPHVTLARP